MNVAQTFIVKDVPGIVIGVFDISGFDLVGIILVDLNEDFIAETDGDIVITFVVDAVLSICYWCGRDYINWCNYSFKYLTSSKDWCN